MKSPHLHCPRAVPACLLAAVAGAAAHAAQIPLLNPSPDLGDLFGFSVSAVGSDKVIVGAPGNDVEGSNEGAAYLFDLDGNLLTTYFGPGLIPQEFFGARVLGAGDFNVLISGTQLPDKQGAPTLPGAAYLFDLNGKLSVGYQSPNPTAGDAFGIATAFLPSNLLLIGAPGDDGDGADAGRVYLFVMGNQAPIGSFSDPTPQQGGGFGAMIATLDATRFVVAAPGANGGDGELHVFDVKGGFLLTIPNPKPGFELVTSLATMGDKIVVGSESVPVNGVQDAGLVAIFDSTTGALENVVPNPAPHFDDAFGVSVAALGSGRFAVGADLHDTAGVDDSGSVFLFHASGSQVGEFPNPEPAAGDQFGTSVAAIGCNGLIVGAPQGADVFTPSGPGKAGVFTGLNGGCLPNYVSIQIAKAQLTQVPQTFFSFSIEVIIPDVPGVTGVNVITGGKVLLQLFEDQGGQWDEVTALPFDLKTLQAFLQGQWTVEILGDQPSITTFNFDAQPLSGYVFFDPATNVFPAQDATGIAPTVAFSWDNPILRGSADGLFVESDSINGALTDNSVLGTLQVDDTSWQPPVNLGEGLNIFGVIYADLDDFGLVDGLQVQSGSIVWGGSPFAPASYPPATALLAFSSERTVSFTVSAGVGFNEPQEFPAAGLPSVQAVGDLNRDGFIDVVVAIPDPNPANPGQVQAFLNLGVFKGWEGLEPQPPFPAGKEPRGIALGFFDKDFHPDLAVTNAGDNTVSIYINNGDGTFQALTPLPTGNRPSAVTTGDFNEDFLTDLAITNEDDDTVLILLGDGQGGFSSPAALPVFSVGVAPIMVASGDFDGNKCPDLSGSNQGNAGAEDGTSGTVFVALGLQHAGFMVTLYPVGNLPSDVANADLNRDGLDDIAAVNTGDGTVSLLINQGDGTVAPGPLLAVGAQPLSIEAVDLNGDGRPDLAVVAIDRTIGPAVQVLLNTSTQPGEVRFAAPVAFPVNATPLFVVSGDFDGDGAPDLVTVNQDQGGSGGSVTVLVSNPVPPPPCVADLDGDGQVRSNDFMALLDAWGACTAGVPCRADLNGDGQVSVIDFLLMLQSWGPC